MVERKKSKKQSAKRNREPNASQLFNKVNTVSESTKALSREIKGMAKIFKENQKVLVSMSDMMQSLNMHPRTSSQSSSSAHVLLSGRWLWIIPIARLTATYVVAA